MAVHTAESGPALGCSSTGAPTLPSITRPNLELPRVLGQSTQSGNWLTVWLAWGLVNPSRGETSTVNLSVPGAEKPWGRTVQTTCCLAVMAFPRFP